MPKAAPTASGLLAFAQLAPCVFFAPILSTFADRHQPGKVLVAGYAAQAIGMGLLAAALIAHAPTATRVRPGDPGGTRLQPHPTDRERAPTRRGSQPGRADRR